VLLAFSDRNLIPPNTASTTAKNHLREMLHSFFYTDNPDR